MLTYIADIEKEARRLFAKEIEPFRFSDFHLFEENGNRLVYEQAYFERRNRLCAFTLMYLLTGEAPYLKALENAVWAVCDEFSWALPAHIPPEMPLAWKQLCLDLFASETGAALAEMKALLGGKLSPLVRERLEYEVRRRILDAFLFRNKDNQFEYLDNNWAAVCAGAIGIAFHYEGSEKEKKAAMPRFNRCFENFLKGFSADGACLEGYTYWWYGFVFYCMFHDLNNSLPISNEKLNKIAQFQQKVIVGEDLSLTFSDNNILKFCYDRGLTHFLYRNFKGVELPPDHLYHLYTADHCHRFGPQIRNFTWVNPELKSRGARAENVYFREAAWYIKNRPGYCFTAKGGHNGEPHNHNDLGSFCIGSPTEYFLCDLGAGEYTRDYFDGEARYTYFVNSSLGHSVPVIEGKGQKAGKSAKAEVITGNHCFELELNQAYEVETLKSFRRSFDFLDGEKILLTDRFTFEERAGAVTERFISVKKP